MSKTENQAIFIDLAADGTAQGKSTLAIRMRAHCEDAGLKTTIVRIESQHAALGMREGDVLIPVEAIGNMNRAVGGIVGILEPGLNAVSRMMSEGGAVIFDWGGGLADYRLEGFAATGLDEKLAAAGIDAWSVVVATASEASMAQAIRLLAKTATFAPGFRRAVALNALGGGFNFPSGTASGRLFAELKRHEGLSAVLKIPLVSGQAMSSLGTLRHDHRVALDADAASLAQETRLSVWVAEACLANFSQWYEATRAEVAKIIPFSS